MLDENIVPVFGKPDMNPDSIPRGFIHREPNMLDPHMQHQLNLAKSKIIDHDKEYLKKHPQVEALLSLLLREVLVHKPYYVRDFIKDILSREDLETQVAKFILNQRLNTNIRHTQKYFSHTQNWEDKAEGKGDSDPEEPTSPWPEPRPYRIESRRDKRAYCHPHYFKMRYVFYPTELMKRELPDEKVYPRFRNKSYARLFIESFKDIWGDPITNVPPPMNEEEIYAAHAILRKKKHEDMTNEELIKTCIHCRRTNIRNYVYAMTKRDFLNNPLKKRRPSFTKMIETIEYKTANAFLEKAIEAFKKGNIEGTKLYLVDATKMNPRAKWRLSLGDHFVPEKSSAQGLSSNIPDIIFDGTGSLSEYFPLGEVKEAMKKSQFSMDKIDDFTLINKKRFSRSMETIETVCEKSYNWRVPIRDADGKLVGETELSVSIKPLEKKKEKEDFEIHLLTDEVRLDDFKESFIAVRDSYNMMQPTQQRVVVKDLEGNAAETYIKVLNNLEQQENERQSRVKDPLNVHRVRKSIIQIKQGGDIIEPTQQKVLVRDIDGNMSETFVAVVPGVTLEKTPSQTSRHKKSPKEPFKATIVHIDNFDDAVDIKHGTQKVVVKDLLGNVRETHVAVFSSDNLPKELSDKGEENAETKEESKSPKPPQWKIDLEIMDDFFRPRRCKRDNYLTRKFQMEDVKKFM